MEGDKRVAKPSAECPMNPQPTNFIMNEYVAGGPDEMQFPRAMSYMTQGNEKAVKGLKMPY